MFTMTVQTDQAGHEGKRRSWFVLGLVVGLVVGMLLGFGAIVGLVVAADKANGAERTRPLLTHVHASQRYDRPVVRLKREVTRYTSRNVGVISWTEVQQHYRARLLHRPHDHYEAFTNPATDVALMWNTNQWRLVRKLAVRPTQRTYQTIHGFTKRTMVLAVVLDPRPPRVGPRVLVTVGHMPSSVQAGPNFKVGVPSRVAVWKSAVVGWDRLVGSLRARYHPQLVLVTGDWNVDVRLSSWRHRVAGAFPPLHLTWRHPYPVRGTHHGGRLIDASLTNKRGRAQLLAHTNASDHTPYREALWPPRR